jgi:hypothetical protein
MQPSILVDHLHKAHKRYARFGEWHARDSQIQEFESLPYTAKHLNNDNLNNIMLLSKLLRAILGQGDHSFDSWTALLLQRRDGTCITAGCPKSFFSDVKCQFA